MSDTGQIFWVPLIFGLLFLKSITLGSVELRVDYSSILHVTNVMSEILISDNNIAHISDLEKQICLQIRGHERVCETSVLFVNKSSDVLPVINTVLS